MTYPTSLWGFCDSNVACCSMYTYNTTLIAGTFASPNKGRMSIETVHRHPRCPGHIDCIVSIVQCNPCSELNKHLSQASHFAQRTIPWQHCPSQQHHRSSQLAARVLCAAKSPLVNVTPRWPKLQLPLSNLTPRADCQATKQTLPQAHMPVHHTRAHTASQNLCQRHFILHPQPRPPFHRLQSWVLGRT